MPNTPDRTGGGRSGRSAAAQFESGNSVSGGETVYWSHFGLEKQPFRPSVDPASYYPAPSHEEAIAALAAAFARRDAIVVVDGKMGVGKSLVARKWLEDLLPDVPRVVVPNAHAEKPAGLLQAILFDLGKPYHGLTEQELRLSVTGSLLDVASASSHPTVLLLDEAQHLSHAALEELRLLGNLETQRGSALFCVLIAQPTLREALRRPAYELVAQRIAVQLEILPLTAVQSTEYIRQQIRASGGEPEKVFDDDLPPLLASACGGVPRVLNRVAALAMEVAATARADQVDVEAGLEALDRLGLAPGNDFEQSEEAITAVLLPHPARTADPVQSSRGKSTDRTGGDEEAAIRGPKDKASRKRSV